MNANPQVKEIKPVNFLYYRTETTMADLMKHTAISQEIIGEAVRRELPITGALHWHYFGCEGAAKPFALEIAVPVGKIISDYDGKFHFKRTRPFKCICLTHEGSWEELNKSYDSIAKFAADHKLSSTSSVREIYVNSDFENPEANVTEIQFGIQ
ncbi:MAG TPA: GyrI-like domain-containing protein [Cyclobacteriaceae bacterium]|jgi:effector-binding domain-containing protein|nr:GyrI-like domain-containing protein [Cyclobacteriaceae bacterium]